MLSFRQILLAMVATAGIAWLPSSAFAQLGKSGGPVDIESDQLEVVDAERKAVFSGNVDAIQGDTRLKARSLVVYFANKAPAAGASAAAGSVGASFGEIERMVADGDVLYLTPSERARSDYGVYDIKTDQITLTGNVIVTRGDNVIKGDKMLIEVSTGKTTLSSNNPVVGPGKATKPRVRGVFQQTKKATAPANAGATKPAGTTPR